jgi:sugar diacid utilization regulator
VATRAASGAGLQRILDALEERRESLAQETLRQIRAESPTYRRIEDPALLADVTVHTAENHDALRASLASGRLVSAEDLLFIRPHAELRARRGVPLAEFLHAFRIGHRVVWDLVLEVASEDEEARAAALATARPVMEFIDQASMHAAETYLEAQQMLVADAERARRDLIEDLLVGREPPPGPSATAARAAGLDVDTPCVLLVAQAVGHADEGPGLRATASLLAGAVGGPVRALAVARHDEIIVVRAVGEGEARSLTQPVKRVAQRLADQGLALAIGISTVQERPAGLPGAYHEARMAMERLGAHGGVFSLSDLTAFDYLTLGGGQTARRLIPPGVRRFVDEDLADGGQLIATVLEYAAADLNAKAAAERLFIHTNTIHYRLGRIAEKTGCDMRRLSDVLDLLIAIKLAQPTAE